MEKRVFNFGELQVELMPPALTTMMSYRQTGFFSKEAGGQMFASLCPNLWRIESATGPRASDRRGRSFYWPDRAAEQEEINRHYAEGLEFVGDWHTHPERVPRPSGNDLRSVDNVVRESVHRLPGILMCIVGISERAEGLWLSLHRTNGSHSMPSGDRQKTRSLRSP